MAVVDIRCKLDEFYFPADEARCRQNTQCTSLTQCTEVLPKPAGWMKSCPQSSPGCLRSQVSCQGRNGFCIVTGIVGEFHRDGLRGSLRDRSIELLNGSLSLNSLVKTDEAHTFREAGNRTLLRAAWKEKMKKLLKC